MPSDPAARSGRRLDPHLWLALGLAAGAPLALHPAPVAAASMLAAMLLLGAGARRGWVILALALSCLGAGRARSSLAAAGARHDAMVAALDEPARCVVTGTVAHSPIVLRRTLADAASRPPGNDARIDLRVEGADCDSGEVPAGALVRIYGAPDELVRGDRVEAIATLAPVRLFRNPGATHPHVGVALRGVTASGGAVDVLRLERGRGLAAWVDRARRHVRRRIEATFSVASAPYARALVLGETDLRDEEREAFRRSGLAHLLAVSGTHLVIAVLALGRALRLLLSRITPLSARLDVGRLSALVCAGAAWLYADFAGGGGSAYRAAAMMSAAMAIRALGRRPSGLRCFAWSLGGGVLIEPLAVCDLSFALSVAATAGLLVASGPLQRLVAHRSRALAVVLLAIGATLAAVVACAPILLGVGPDLPLIGVVTNVLAAPIGEIVALPICLLHTVLSWVPSVERGAAMVGGGALILVRALAQAASDSPVASFSVPPPTAWQLSVAAVALVALCVGRRPRLVLLATLITLGAAEMKARHDGAPAGRLRVTVLDVGQGDAILVDLPDGRLMVVDGGGLVGSPLDTAERVVMPVLRTRRRSRIDVAVLSHPHPDHYGGLLTLLAEMEVTELWTSGLAASWGPTGTVSKAIFDAEAQGTQLRFARELCGAHAVGEGATLEVLGPCPTFDPGRHVNDNSLVLRIQLGDRAVLLTGDAEKEQEASLLARHPEGLGADLLKVGHHGSRTSSTPAFLRAVTPDLAIASCGVRNRFGHPHEVTRRSFAEAEVPLLTTDRGGALVWETDGEGLRWRRPGASWSGEL